MIPRLLRLLAIILCLCGMQAYAQDGRDLTEEARKQYSAGLKEIGTLIKDRQFATASSRLDALLVQRPREPQARFLKGVVETEQGHVDVAIATFRALVEDYPVCPSPTTTSPCSTRSVANMAARGSRSKRRSAPPPIGPSRARIWATFTRASPQTSTIAPQSSTATINRRPPNSRS